MKTETPQLCKCRQCGKHFIRPTEKECPEGCRSDWYEIREIVVRVPATAGEMGVK